MAKEVKKGFKLCTSLNILPYPHRQTESENKEIDFKNGVNAVQAAGYNGAHTVQGTSIKFLLFYRISLLNLNINRKNDQIRFLIFFNFRFRLRKDSILEPSH